MIWAAHNLKKSLKDYTYDSKFFGLWAEFGSRLSNWFNKGYKYGKKANFRFKS